MKGFTLFRSFSAAIALFLVPKGWPAGVGISVVANAERIFDETANRQQAGPRWEVNEIQTLLKIVVNERVNSGVGLPEVSEL